MILHRRSAFLLSRLLLVLRVSPMTMSKEACSMADKFPSSIRDFGYVFNSEGKLRKIDPATGEAGSEPFEFNVSSDPAYNQKRYEALGELITPYVYQLLSDDVGLKKLPVPDSQDPSTFIFATEDALSNPDKLMVLIHGSGVVRAGQWARSLIINDCLDSGTQIPYIQRAIAQGYGVLVLNTNDNKRTINGKVVTIKGSSDPLEHANWVWENYVTKAKAKKIAVVAHSFGGVCAVELASAYFDDFKSRVFAVALTDSVHQMRGQRLKTEVKEYLYSVGRNWVSSGLPLDKVVEDYKKSDIISVSAGHRKHEMTSWSCIESLFKFLQNNYEPVS
ncbi:FAM172 family protein homolog CG10038 [Thrips palmi]|uniref:FAM172 family protein homolog CG10038 n=1 Tax=Thrips palmi TaxID=161013 RepID=A0A6P8YQP1_THRPL|nr:FAM172 family protein homolog CG10038 [Thrips palmi]